VRELGGDKPTKMLTNEKGGGKVILHYWHIYNCSVGFKITMTVREIRKCWHA